MMMEYICKRKLLILINTIERIGIQQNVYIGLLNYNRLNLIKFCFIARKIYVFTKMSMERMLLRQQSYYLILVESIKTKQVRRSCKLFHKKLEDKNDLSFSYKTIFSVQLSSTITLDLRKK